MNFLAKGSTSSPGWFGLALHTQTHAPFQAPTWKVGAGFLEFHCAYHWLFVLEVKKKSWYQNQGRRKGKTGAGGLGRLWKSSGKIEGVINWFSHCCSKFSSGRERLGSSFSIFLESK